MPPFFVPINNSPSLRARDILQFNNPLASSLYGRRYFYANSFSAKAF